MADILGDMLKSDPKNAKKITTYLNTLKGNFTDAQINDIIKNPYFKDYATGGYAAVFNKMGATDAKTQNELYNSLQALNSNGVNAFDAFKQIAVNPAAFSESLANSKAATEGQKTADPLVEALKTDLSKGQTQSQSYLDRLLASRGLTNSGAVGAGLTDIAGKYAEVLASGSTNIRNTANAAAKAHTVGQYDTQVANTYADRLNKQYLDAIGGYNESKQPTIWDYASQAIGAIPVVGQAKNALFGFDVDNKHTKGIFG